MKFKPVFHLVAFLVMLIGTAMLLTAGISYLMDDPPRAWREMLLAGSVTIACGGITWLLTRGAFELTRREGIGIVVFGWLTAILFGSLPFLLCGDIANPVDAVFEACSGLTTTGSSVMSDLEQHTRATLFWRATLHLLGGMGILVLVVAIIPYLGVGGMQIFNAEVTGPSKDRLTPRIASTAKLLWGVYISMVAALIVLLRIGDMDWFDATCHAFATISTGGFSTRSASIAAYDSVYIETVIIIFMLLSGMNFALHYQALRGRVSCYFKDLECRFYLGLWLTAVLVVTAALVFQGGDGIMHSIRHGAFYVTSVMTCTGFGTVDYEPWPVTAKVVLTLLFIVGGCAGSTSGGIKQVRTVVLIKKLRREVFSFLRPQVVYSIKLGRSIISQDVVFKISAFFFTYLAALAAGTVLMSWYSPDMATAFSSVMSSLANVGPGFSTVGPVTNYAHLHDHAKLILCGAMLLGRLEFYTLLVVLMPTFWVKQ